MPQASPDECGRELDNQGLGGRWQSELEDVEDPEFAAAQIEPSDLFQCVYVFELIPGCRVCPAVAEDCPEPAAARRAGAGANQTRHRRTALSTEALDLQAESGSHHDVPHGGTFGTRRVIRFDTAGHHACAQGLTCRRRAVRLLPAFKTSVRRVNGIGVSQYIRLSKSLSSSSCMLSTSLAEPFSALCTQCLRWLRNVSRATARMAFCTAEI